MISLDSQERLIIQWGGGRQAIFAIPFVIAGVALLALVLSGTLTKDKLGFEVPTDFWVLFGLTLTTLGGVAAFGRSAKILDRRQGTVTSWWGVLVPIRSTTRRLEEFCEVSLSREERTIDHSTYIVFPVRLKATDGKDFTLQESRKDGEARQAAKQFAKYLGLPLVDTTHGTPIVRQPHELDVSLRERAQCTGTWPEIPKAPPGGRTSYRIEDDTLILEIPPLGFSTPLLVQFGTRMVLLNMIGLVLVVLAMTRGSGVTAVLINVGTLAGVFLLWFGFLTIQDARRRTIVRLTPDTLTVTIYGLLRSRTSTIPADELEELEIVSGPNQRRHWRRYGSGQSILARSDNAAVQFGEGLSREELHWLRDVVHTMMTA